jgi:hypothetical protein
MHTSYILQSDIINVAGRKIVKFMTHVEVVSRRRANYLKKHYNDYMHCFVFQIETDKICKHFDLFTNQKYISNNKEHIIIKTDHGVIFRIMYECDGYIASSAFKTTNPEKSDNLLFEYMVGRFINTKCGIFPCFVETYGLIIYMNKDLQHMVTSKGRTSEYDYNPYIKINNQTKYLTTCFDRMCLSSKYKDNNMALITQYIRNVSLEDSMNIIFCRYHLLYILYQIYMPLSVLSNQYTHYDLHSKNILLYKVATNSHVIFHYHLKDHKYGTEEIVSFKSKFIVKIIDYGRSFFVDPAPPIDGLPHTSKEVYDRMYNVMSQKFGPIYNRDYNPINGLDWGANNHSEHDFFISSIMRNKSHDLRLIHELKKDHPNELLFNKPLFNLMHSVEYGVGIKNPKYKTYGTKEQTISGLSRGKIVNVNDMQYSLKMLIKNVECITLHNNYYNNSKKVGDIYIYDTEQPFKYIPY